MPPSLTLSSINLKRPAISHHARSALILNPVDGPISLPPPPLRSLLVRDRVDVTLSAADALPPSHPLQLAAAAAYAQRP